ncbi:MAG TPA: IS200/IS605 family transposase [Saprospirales bacterium]|nr:IS200/IS605 family transposase [Saprospirales bacterium]HAY71193.1 IS200/IS605 family transposase [Saprospirales bacterium]HRQ29397.1 IS200/IS605 family transposase [Saprospiraceae bacterium]
MSYTSILYHLIIRTKSSRKTLSLTHSEDLYRYIWGYIKNKHCKLYRINGIEDHIHILFSLHPAISLSDFVRDLKAESSKMLKRTKGFENFSSWSEGYAALTISHKEKDVLIRYIKDQRDHHKNITFEEEYRSFIQAMGLQIDSRDWEK